MTVFRNLAASIVVVLGTAGAPAFASQPITENVTEADPIIAGQSSFAACSEARPNAYLDLCNRFTTEPGTVRCIAAGRGAYFAECSLALCNRFNTEDGAVRCLEAARNKTYTTNEIALCNRFTTEFGAIDCLQSSGARYGGSDDAILRRVRRDIELALDDIYAGRTRQAALILEDTLNQIDSSNAGIERN